MLALRDERGFALPTTIFLVAILTVMLAAAFARASSDHEVSDGSQAMEEALSIAQSGLQRYMESASTRPQDGDSIRINTTGGYAWVKAHSLQSPADTMQKETFVIQSTGYVVESSQGSEPVAERTVAQMAYWQVGQMIRPAAWVAANGVETDRRSEAVISGNDTNGLRAPQKPTPRSTITITGSPDAVDWGGGGRGVANETGVDWQQIRDGEFAYDTDRIFSGNSDLTWKTYFIDGDLTYNKWFGTGLLIVTGDLRITGGALTRYFAGVILVGGTITFDSRNTIIWGMLESGLDEQIPGLASPSSTMIGERNKRVEISYMKNNVDAVVAQFTGLVPLENTWIDNWSTY